MANMQYAFPPIDYVVTASGSSNFSTTLYPSGMVKDLARPRRFAKITSLGSGIQNSIVCWLGASPVTVGVFSCENFNFATVRIEGSDTAANPWTSYGTFALNIDPDDGRRKAICVPSPTFTKRFVRFRSNDDVAPILAADTFFTFGAFGAFATLNTLSKNFGTPYDKTIEDSAEEIKFAGGGLEVGYATPAQVQLSLSARMPRTDTTSIDQFRGIALNPRNVVMLVYENQANITKMYHMRRTASMKSSRADNATMAYSSIELAEVV